MSNSIKLSLTIAALGLSLALSSVAQAASPYGIWLRPSNGANVLVYKCKGGLGMKVTKSSTPSKVGKVIMCGAKADGENKWKGSLLNLDDGKTYSGVITLNGPKSLTLEGCVLGGLICKGDTWNKIK